MKTVADYFIDRKALGTESQEMAPICLPGSHCKPTFSDEIEGGC